MSCLQMHFLADHAIESCHQSLAASQFRLLGVEGRLGRGRLAKLGRKKCSGFVCARASAVAAGKGARGVGRAPARVLPASDAGRLLFLSWRLGHWHVAVSAGRRGRRSASPSGGRIPQPLAGPRSCLPEPPSRGDMSPRRAALWPLGPPFV